MSRLTTCRSREKSIVKHILMAGCRDLMQHDEGKFLAFNFPPYEHKAENPVGKLHDNFEWEVQYPANYNSKQRYHACLNVISRHKSWQSTLLLHKLCRNWNSSATSLGGSDVVIKLAWLTLSSLIEARKLCFMRREYFIVDFHSKGFFFCFLVSHRNLIQLVVRQKRDRNINKRNSIYERRRRVFIVCVIIHNLTNLSSAFSPNKEVFHPLFLESSQVVKQTNWIYEKSLKFQLLSITSLIHEWKRRRKTF